MQIILTQEEVNQILKDYLFKTCGVKVIDVSSYKPYTFEIQK